MSDERERENRPEGAPPPGGTSPGNPPSAPAPGRPPAGAGEFIGPESLFRGDFMFLFTLPVLLTTLAGVIMGVFVATDPLEGRPRWRFYEKYAPMTYDAFPGFSSYADEDRSPPPMIMLEMPKMPGGTRGAPGENAPDEETSP